MITLGGTIKKGSKGRADTNNKAIQIKIDNFTRSY